MKIKNNRAIKCVTCLVTCFMLVVAGMATPVKAGAHDVDPANYVSSISVEDGVKTVYYDFAGVEPHVNAWDSSTNGIIAGPDYWELGQGAKQFALTLSPIGGYFPEGADCNNYRILVSDIMPGCPIDIYFSVGVTYSIFGFSDGLTFYDGFTAGFYTYDENGKYLDTVSLRVEGAIKSDSADHFGFDYEIEGTIPLNAYAILPWFKLDCWLGDYDPDLRIEVAISPSTLKMSTAVDSIVEQSHQMEVIKDKLNNILTGTPEQNESANNSAGTVEDQKDQIQDLVDQMTPSKPDTSVVDPDINAWAGDEATALFADGMSDILNNSLILGMLSIVSVVCFIGYVLFGKVG